MVTDKNSKRIKLRDGRTLGYAEYGASEAKPVFYFHGWPGARVDWLLVDPDGIAAQVGARIIASDRPGFGLSDFKQGRKLLDWPDDVIELADALEINRFAVFGYSGGGPFAAACAFKIPERLTTVGIAAVAAPFDVPGATDGMASAMRMRYTLARRLPFLFRFMWKQITLERFLQGALRTLPEPESLPSPDLR